MRDALSSSGCDGFFSPGSWAAEAASTEVTSDTASLQGSRAFAVALTAINLGTPKAECGFTDTTADGGIAAAAIQIFEKNESAFTCGTGGPANPGAYVEIGIATPEYVGGKRVNLTESIAPGNYPIGQPSASQPYCSIPSNATAFLQVGTFDGFTTSYAWESVLGTITITNASNTTLAGSFATQLTDTGGANADGGTLTGTFTASTCP